MECWQRTHLIKGEPVTATVMEQIDRSFTWSVSTPGSPVARGAAPDRLTAQVAADGKLRAEHPSHAAPCTCPEWQPCEGAWPLDGRGERL